MGLKGAAYTVDAACATSLYALKLAVDELRSGRADAMLSGGVSRPDLFTPRWVSRSFAHLAQGKAAPFDHQADGLVVGEGAGMFVLKRLEDAIRHGDHIYGVVAGIGLSNDVEGICWLRSPGQLRAMRMAYEQAGWSPATSTWSSATPRALPRATWSRSKASKVVWGSGAGSAQCAIGSVKSNIGHALTAAGAAGLLKVLLALKNRACPLRRISSDLPPTSSWTTARSAF